MDHEQGEEEVGDFLISPDQRQDDQPIYDDQPGEEESEGQMEVCEDEDEDQVA